MPRLSYPFDPAGDRNPSSRAGVGAKKLAGSVGRNLEDDKWIVRLLLLLMSAAICSFFFMGVGFGLAGDGHQYLANPSFMAALNFVYLLGLALWDGAAVYTIIGLAKQLPLWPVLLAVIFAVICFILPMFFPMVF